jgi:DNA-binding beta-propeller fold protein YncE
MTIENRTEETTGHAEITASPAEAEYPDLLRMGHVFVTSVGHRNFVDGFYGALDVAIGGDGWYYVLNKVDPRLRLFEKLRFAKVDLNDQYEPNIFLTIDGKYEEYDNETLPGPVCCDSDLNGTLFLTDEHANKVALLSTDGVMQSYWGESGDEPGQLNAPSGISWQPDGTLWVVSTRSSRVQQFTRDGEYLRGFGEFGTEPGQLNYPWGIAVDPVDGSVLVTDWRNDRVQRFTPGGELMHVFDSLVPGKAPLNRPSDVAVDAHGDVYVCDRGNDRVVQFNHRGLFIESLHGDAPMTERGANRLMGNPDMLRWRDYIPDLEREKRFWRPISVKVDDQFRVFVVDAARFRMQVYQKTFRELDPGQIDPVDTYTDPKIN